ncbi:MAG: hypothetical protein KDD94_15365, partial [Calditrichaeota bacterium]|nr:hypothetical protein [Calditrichota bacterium]
PTFYVFWKKLVPVLIIILLVVLLYIFVAPTLFRVLFPAYPEAVILTQILALGVAPTLVINLHSAILKSKQATVELYWINVINNIGGLLVSSTTLYLYGLIGFAISIITFKLLIAVLCVLAVFHQKINA